MNTGNDKKPTFNEKAKFTVNAKSSEEKVIPRRSGGGSGGMPVTHEPKNVAAKEIMRSFAAAKTPVRLAFTGADNIITALAFTPMENAGKVVVKVEMLKGKPAAAKSAPQGEVFQYIDVEISKGVGNNLENAELTFKVPKEWVDGLDPGSSVLMQHYENDEWVNCPTERKAELDDEENYVYSAKANSFSPFAITATKEKAVDIPPLESESPDSENKPGSEVESEPDEEKKGIPGFEILFAVGGLGVSALVRRQRKN
ncbi:MAG: PGF-pre-PGF domain-containing protein [Methanosarcinaceae archaeon]|nr:PGF-pre-PGF domain-containing protein [Methanosarcinaceae archaeon]